jgi:DNA-binding CsgD family transcriptional regulator
MADGGNGGMTTSVGGEPGAHPDDHRPSSGSLARAAGSWLRARRPLLDRSSERDAISELLGLVRRGFSGVLVFRGGPGVGKTAMAGYAAGAAPGFLISVVAGVESEIDLRYGAVHELLMPFLPLAGELPVPQRQALRVAFGMEAGLPPDRFLVGLACLTLLSRAAADQPVLCAVDDAQWIDPESALVLGFVARRLYADRIGMILTVDDAGEPSAFALLPTMDLGGLPGDAAAELLRSVSALPVEPAVVDRVVAETDGNPLAIVEVGTHFTAEELAAQAHLPGPFPAGRQLQQRYLRRVQQLPPDVQEYVLVAAADISGDRSTVRKAAAASGIDPGSAEQAAEGAELIDASDNVVRFRHPLIRSAVYHGASQAARRRAHQLLSQAGGYRDAQEQVWHRAAAAAGPDEHLCADLQAAAQDARDHGALSVAAALLRRSVALTPGNDVRALREVALAQAELLAGRPTTAQHIADDALPRLPKGGPRGHAQVVIGEALVAQGRSAEAAEVLAGAAAALAADPAASADALLAALNAAMWVGPAETSKIARIPAPSPATTPRISDLLLAGYQTRFTRGYDAAVAPLRAAVRALTSDDVEHVPGMKWLEMGVVAAGSLWDDQALIDITSRWERLTRRAGALTQLPVAMAFRALADWHTGRLAQAADRWDEMQELMAASQTPGLLGIDSRSEGLLLAYRGELSRARASGQAQIREATARGQGAVADIGRCIVVLADVCAGHNEAAVDSCLPVTRNDHPLTAELMLPELIEAAVRSDRQQVARTAYTVLAGRAETAATPWALGIRARCQALLEDGSQAEGAYVEAISQLEHSHAAVDLARTHLLYGRWLRRVKRRRDARGQLRTADEMFRAMGAGGFAEHADGELAATGERARKRTPDTELDLTPQEGRVGSLAAAGATNNEIAEQLFLSPSTVDYHLGKVFRKLGVRSRAQLARRLPGRT